MPKITTLFVASDHAGFPLKKHLMETYPDLPWSDLGPESEDRVDYPDYADLVAQAIQGSEQMGVLICGSGQGMVMRANRFPHIRAAMAWNNENALLSREHNDANVIGFGARTMDWKEVEKSLITFLNTEFTGGRHQGRIEKLNKPV